MDTFPDEPDELESHLAEIQRLRYKRLAHFHADRAAWEEEGKQMAAHWANKVKMISFVKGGPNCVPDDYRYADLCPPPSPESDYALKFPIEAETETCS